MAYRKELRALRDPYGLLIDEMVESEDPVPVEGFGTAGTLMRYAKQSNGFMVHRKRHDHFELIQLRPMRKVRKNLRMDVWEILDF